MRVEWGERWTYHIETEDGDAGSNVVLVKDTGEFVVDEDGALVKAITAKGVVGTSLELELLDMKNHKDE